MESGKRADVFHVMATTRHDTVVTRWAIDRPVHDLFNGSWSQLMKSSSGQNAKGSWAE